MRPIIFVILTFLLLATPAVVAYDPIRAANRACDHAGIAQTLLGPYQTHLWLAWDHVGHPAVRREYENVYWDATHLDRQCDDLVYAALATAEPVYPLLQYLP